MIKKFAIAILMLAVSNFSLAAGTQSVYNIDTENMPVMDLESQENTEYWTNIFNIIQDAQKKGSTKVVIKYDGKWKYVIPTSEALIQMDIIMTHLTSGSSIKDGSFEMGMKKAFEIGKNDKMIVTIR